MAHTRRIMVVYGTRPEAIKVAPVIRALNETPGYSSVAVVTGQHREMLDQVNAVFGLEPDRDLNVFMPGQSLNQLFEKVVARLDSILAAEAPDAVLVQGDTSSVAAAAIAAFNRKVPVFHLEAGLRSGDIMSPYPEEANRRISSVVTALHLAPTARARENLISEGIASESITVTGNTVIDALAAAVKAPLRLSDQRLESLVSDRCPFVLVTTHRRENWGQALENIGAALSRLASEHPDLHFVLPLHRNPIVRESLSSTLRAVSNVLLTEPLPYGEFVHVLNASAIVLTDSGGVQEEAPSLGKPVLVMRDNTERPEAVSAGAVKLIGTDEHRIVSEVSELYRDSTRYSAMSRAVNPYGDGMAAPRVVAAIRHYFGDGPRAIEFRPA